MHKSLLDSVRESSFKRQVQMFLDSTAHLAREGSYFKLSEMSHDDRVAYALYGKKNELILELEVPVSGESFNPNVGFLRIRDSKVIGEDSGSDYLVSASANSDGKLLGQSFFVPGAICDAHFVRKLYAIGGEPVEGIAPVKSLRRAMHLGVEVMDITGRGNGRDVVDRQLRRGDYEFSA